jgi:glutamyl-tRNA synthetase
VPEGRGLIQFTDAVYGDVSFPADVMDDMVLVRTDGSPTYNFAVVCDDANMGITHVIRGDDHLSNTPRQILIYEALGYALPTFAHLPMILGADGKKLSKRHGATNVEDYRDRGYLPAAVVNFLALLGWSLDGETTIISPEELCRVFSLDRITKKDSVFDEKKLNWMNGVYIREMPAAAFTSVAAPWIAQTKLDAAQTVSELSGAKIAPSLTKEELEAYTLRFPGTDHAPEEFDAQLKNVTENTLDYEPLYALLGERLQRLGEIPSKLEYLYWGPNVRLDEKSVNKVLLKEGARAGEALAICREILATESIAWETNALQDACKAAGEAADLKPKLLFQPLRVAVSGNMVSPPLFESIELMSRADVLARIDATVSLVFKGE